MRHIVGRVRVGRCPGEDSLTGRCMGSRPQCVTRGWSKVRSSRNSSAETACVCVCVLMSQLRTIALCLQPRSRRGRLCKPRTAPGRTSNVVWIYRGGRVRPVVVQVCVRLRRLDERCTACPSSRFARRRRPALGGTRRDRAPMRITRQMPVQCRWTTM